MDGFEEGPEAVAPPSKVRRGSDLRGRVQPPVRFDLIAPTAGESEKAKVRRQARFQGEQRQAITRNKFWTHAPATN
jgi:hypothetical protein